MDGLDVVGSGTMLEVTGTGTSYVAAGAKVYRTAVYSVHLSRRVHGRGGAEVWERVGSGTILDVTGTRTGHVAVHARAFHAASHGAALSKIIYGRGGADVRDVVGSGTILEVTTGTGTSHVAVDARVRSISAHGGTLLRGENGWKAVECRVVLDVTGTRSSHVVDDTLFTTVHARGAFEDRDGRGGAAADGRGSLVATHINAGLLGSGLATCVLRLLVVVRQVDIGGGRRNAARRRGNSSKSGDASSVRRRLRDGGVLRHGFGVLFRGRRAVLLSLANAERKKEKWMKQKITGGLNCNRIEDQLQERDPCDYGRQDLGFGRDAVCFASFASLAEREGGGRKIRGGGEEEGGAAKGFLKQGVDNCWALRRRGLISREARN